MLYITEEVVTQIHAHGERHYPEEGAGLIFGKYTDSGRTDECVMEMKNSSQPDSRHNRYHIEANDVLACENHAENLAMAIIGVFHSHPDHPAQPSDFDLAWALPSFPTLLPAFALGKRCQVDLGGYRRRAVLLKKVYVL